MLERVVSGGQTGVDEAALVAAKSVGLKTGGFMPKGFRRLDGNHPEFVQLYGMLEDAEYGYKHRTWQNVLCSDATIRIARNFESPGEWCTLNAIKHYNKKHLDIDESIVKYTLSHGDFMKYFLDPFVHWIVTNQVKTLNVAGNSEHSAPGIFVEARDFLTIVFGKFITAR